MRALRRAGFNPPWPTEVDPTTRHSCRLWALFHVNRRALSLCDNTHVCGASVACNASTLLGTNVAHGGSVFDPICL